MISKSDIKAAQEAGASKMYTTYIKKYPNSRAALKLEEVSETNPAKARENGDFIQALWDGDERRMATKWDTKNKRRCHELFGEEIFEEA